MLNKLFFGGAAALRGRSEEQRGGRRGVLVRDFPGH